MKTMTKTVSLPLCAAVALGMFAVSARAIEVANTDCKADTKVEARTQPKHGLKIVHRTEARMDKLATMLKQHTLKVADKTEEAGKRVVAHVEDFGQKVGDIAKKTADRIQKHIDDLYE